MVVSDVVSFRYGEDAAERLSQMDLARLAKVDPYWADPATAPAVMRLLREDKAALVEHADGAWGLVEPYYEDGRRILWVLAASAHNREAFRQAALFLDAVAHYAGCSEIRFGSLRKGWQRHAARYGFEPDGDGYYRKEVA